MPYAWPAPSTTWVTASWQSHKNRNPPSSEPGTDVGTAYGAQIVAVENGIVTYVKTSNSSATGRVVEYALDDGRTSRTLHMAEVHVGVGQRVTRGQGLGLSGASGYGDDWYYGPHAHQTLWNGSAWSGPTIDFELYVGDVVIPPPPNTPTGEAVMYIKALSNGTYAVKGYSYSNDIGGHWRGLTNLEGDGYLAPLAGKQLPYAEFNGTDLDLLFAVNGLWEQVKLGADAPVSSVGKLIGLGHLTGYLQYPGTPGYLGQWHNPYTGELKPAEDSR